MLPMLEPVQFASIFPKADAGAWAPAIAAAWERFGFRTVNARAGYLGICGNESGAFTHVGRENMAYSAERAKAVFKKARNQPAICEQRCAAGAEAFANWIYADIIGNGPESSGDGFRFRGGGIVQLTGRANFKACGDALGVDLIADPDLLTRSPDVSAAAAAWFMAVHARILPLLDSSDDADFLAAARRVGLPPDDEATRNRLAYRSAALAALGGGAGASAAVFDRARIARIQETLNARGALPRLATDGSWGPRTQAAAARYRAANMLPAAEGPTEDLASSLGV